MSTTSNDSVDEIARVKYKSQSSISQADLGTHPALRPVAPKVREPWYRPADRTVRRNFWVNTIVGIVMIAIMTIGALVGVAVSVFETRGALASVTGPTPDTPTASSTTFVTPSIFTTLIPSDFTTLVPSMVTISIFVLSDATTLIPSVVTAERRDGPVITAVPAFTSATPIGKTGQVTNTVRIMARTTTTVIIAQYSTTFGGHNRQGDQSGNGVSLNTCGGGAEQACMSTKDNTQSVQDISTTSISLLDGNLTSNTVADTTGSSLPTLTTVTSIPASAQSSNQATASYTMMCDVAGISTLVPCSPVPTGFYISAATQGTTSFLHPIFHILASIPSRIKGAALIKPATGVVMNSFPTPPSAQRVGLHLYTRVAKLARYIGVPPPARLVRAEDGESLSPFLLGAASGSLKLKNCTST